MYKYMDSELSFDASSEGLWAGGCPLRLEVAKSGGKGGASINVG